MKILVLIPAYNEEKNIEETVNNVKKAINYDCDIVVVNDGSTDKTLNVLSKIKDIRILNLPFNLGYGVALQTGYKFALENGYDLVAQIDADGQHDPKYINGMIEKMLGSNVDVIIGSRFLGKKGYEVPKMRKIGIYVFSKIASLIMKKKITDSTSGYQLISKKVLPFLVSKNFPYDYPDADLLIMLYFSGFKILEYPVKMYKSKSNQSMHKSLFKNIYYVLKMGLSIFTELLRKVTKLSSI